MLNGSRPDSRSLTADVRHLAGRVAGHRLANRRDVRRRGAAAAAHHVHEPGRGELAQHAGHRRRRVVVAAEGIGQARVGVHADAGVGDPRQLADVRAQVLRAERAVEADDERVDVPQGVPEGLGRLAGQRAAGRVRDRAREHHGNAQPDGLAHAGDRVERGLGVQRVEDRLHQDEVGAALEQRPHRVHVGGDQFVEADVAQAGVVDVRRDGRRAAGGAEHAGDEAPLAGPRADLVGHRPGQPRAGQVQLVHAAFRARSRPATARWS